MGLSFDHNSAHTQNNFSPSPTSEQLTAENIRFLNKLGFTVTDNGYTGYKTRACIRRDSMGKGISHTPTLRFIEIRK